jgi:hypothetical protein
LNSLLADWFIGLFIASIKMRSICNTAFSSS